MVWDILSWLFFILFIAGLVVVGALLLRGYMAKEGSGGSFSGSFFGPKPDKRLDVVDQASVDGRRRLVLIRRDNVEHLIMTGGPVDVVIETNIESKGGSGLGTMQVGRLDGGKVEPIDKRSVTGFNRPARTFGKTADEN